MIKIPSQLEYIISQTHGLRTDIRPTWIDVLRERPVSEWVAQVSRITVDGFKHIISRSIPPKFRDLESLGVVDTDLQGVYWDLVTQDDGSGQQYLYVGSATSERGLEHRIAQHQRAPYSSSQAYVHISTTSGKCNLTLITLSL